MELPKEAQPQTRRRSPFCSQREKGRPFDAPWGRRRSRAVTVITAVVAYASFFHFPTVDFPAHSSLDTCTLNGESGGVSSQAAKRRSSCQEPKSPWGRSEPAESLFLYAAAAERPAHRYGVLVRNEIVSNLAGVPVELMVKDIWAQLFHKTGRKFWLDFLFWLRGYFVYRDARKVAVMIARELQLYLFEEAPVNDTAWKAVRRLLEQHLREWWVNTPEDPYRGLTAGVWKALVNVYVELLEPALRGSPKLKELEDLLFDPELKIIKSWTDAAHLNIVRGREEEIVAKLDTLARERPKERKGAGAEREAKASLAVVPTEEERVTQPEQNAAFTEYTASVVTEGRKSRMSRRTKQSKKTKAQ